MPPTETFIPSEVTQTVYGVEGLLDVPLIILALLLTVVAVIVSKRKSYLLLAVALVCFTFKHAVFYLDLDPTPRLTEAQQWVGTLGWLLVTAFAGVSIRRRSGTPLATAE